MPPAAYRFPQSTLDSWAEVLADLPQDRADLLPWIEGPLRNFFGFRRLFCAYGELTAGQIRLQSWLASGHHADYLEQLHKTFEVAQRHSLSTWLMTRRPFLIEPIHARGNASDFELDEIRQFGLGNVAAHGILNLRSNAGSYFSFSGFDAPLSEWHLHVLLLIVPTLSDLFMTLHAAQPSAQFDAALEMTPRQCEIARLVAEGHDNKTIGSMLSISEKTVRNQLSKVFEKAGLQRRTQLVERLR